VSTAQSKFLLGIASAGAAFALIGLAVVLRQPPEEVATKGNSAAPPSTSPSTESTRADSAETSQRAVHKDEQQDAGESGAGRHAGKNRVLADGHAFSLIPPGGWRQVLHPLSILTFQGPTDDGFAANFTVSADPYDGQPPLDDLPKETRSSLPPQFTPLEDGFTEIDNKRAYFVRTVTTVQRHRVVNVQYFLPVKQTMYSVSFACKASEYPQYKPLWKSVLDSVHAD